MNNLPIFDPQQFITRKMKQVQKKPPKDQQQPEWDSQKMQLTQVGLPTRISSQHISKKFKIKLEYKDREGKIRSKTVFFGDNEDYFFSKNQSVRLKKMVHMKHTDNPLHPNYWKVLLLNAHDTPEQGMKQFMSYFMNKQLGKKPQKVFNKEKFALKYQKMRSKFNNKK